MRCGEEGKEEDEDEGEAALGGSYEVALRGQISTMLGKQETNDHMEYMLFHG